MILIEKCNQLEIQWLFWWKAKRSVESGVETRTQKAQFYALLRYLNLRHDESKAYAFLRCLNLKPASSQILLVNYHPYFVFGCFYFLCFQLFALHNKEYNKNNTYYSAVGAIFFPSRAIRSNLAPGILWSENGLIKCLKVI